MKQIKETLSEVEGNTEEIEKHFEELLNKYTGNSDKLIIEYGEDVKNAVDGRLTNDQISYYMNNFGHLSYILGASLARQGLSSDLVSIHHNVAEATAFTQAISEDGKKLTREDKQSIATLETEAEKIVGALYKRVTEAVDQRMWGVNRILKTLETLASMNMSDAKLGRNQ